MTKTKDKNPGGRPPLFKTEKELENKINSYFDEPPTRSIFQNGIEFKAPVITITGLALHLGFASRQSIHDYAKSEKFSYIIKKAIARVEQGYEENLHFPGCTGSIFALKTMGWREKEEETKPQEDRNITINLIDAKKPDAY